MSLGLRGGRQREADVSRGVSRPCLAAAARLRMVRGGEGCPEVCHVGDERPLVRLEEQREGVVRYVPRVALPLVRARAQLRSTTTTKSCQQTRHFTSQPDGHPSASVSVQQLKKDGGGAWPHLREGAAVTEVRWRHKTADRIVRHVEGRRDERADAGVVPAEPDVVGVGGELVGARWAVRRAARRQEVPTLSRLTGVRTFRQHRSL